MGTEINITRCNLLLNRKVIKALANQIELANYYEGCPPLYTTSLITNAPATFITSIKAFYSAQESFNTDNATPGSTYVVPAVTTTYKPSMFVKSLVKKPGSSSDTLITNYYSDINGTGNCVGSALTSESETSTTGTININYYFGSNNSGNSLGSFIATINATTKAVTANFYSEANGNGQITASGVFSTINGVLQTNQVNWYSGTNGSGTILGSANNFEGTRNTQYYSGANTTGSVIMSFEYIGTVVNYYSGANGGGNLGLMVNSFFEPFPLTTISNGVSTEMQPSLTLGSVVYNGVNYNYYSGPNGTGDVLGSWVNPTNNGVVNDSILNYYTGSNGSGTPTGSASNYLDGTTDLYMGNYYSELNNAGNVLGSVKVDGEKYYYSGSDGGGNLLGTSEGNNYYNASSSSIGSREIVGEIENLYTGTVSSGTLGVYLNIFFMPYTFNYTIPSYTVTVPASNVITTHTAIYSLMFPTPLPATPTGVYLTKNLTNNLIGSGCSANTIYLNGPQIFSNNQIIYVVVGTDVLNLTIENSIVYNNILGYTIPATSTNIPAVSQISQPSMLVGSFTPNDSIPCYNYYSEANGQGIALGSEVISTTGPGRIFYSGLNGTGNLLASKIYNTGATENLPIFNYYTGSSNSGNLLLSGTGDAGGPSTYYSGANVGGTELGSRQNSSSGYSFYSAGENGLTSVLIGEMTVTTYNGAELANTYTIVNGVSNSGLYLNPVFLPYPFTETTPAHTVTTPAVNYPAINSLTVSIPLEAVPTAVYAINNGIADTTNNLLGSDSTLTNVNLNKIETFSIGNVVQFIVNGSPVNLTITNINTN